MTPCESLWLDDRYVEENEVGTALPSRAGTGVIKHTTQKRALGPAMLPMPLLYLNPKWGWQESGLIAALISTNYPGKAKFPLRWCRGHLCRLAQWVITGIKLKAEYKRSRLCHITVVKYFDRHHFVHSNNSVD